MIDVVTSLSVRTLVAATDGTKQAGLPVALAHGFTQNAGCWGDVGEALGSSGRQVVAVDAPGHGESLCDEDDLQAAGDRLIATSGPADWVGYSMGGRMLLHAALGENAGAVRSLVLIGATGGIDDESEREDRRTRDNLLADRIDRIGTHAFIDEWLATPMFADLGDRACRQARLVNRAAGMASSLRNCGTGTQLPLWDRLHTLQMPVLVIAGARDEKFTELGHRLVEAIGDNATFAAVPGGHAVHLENPMAAAHTIGSWSS